MFVFPWEGATAIGTTDLDHVADIDEEASITAEEVADWADTINYEIYCALSHRVPRYYSDGE